MFSEVRKRLLESVEIRKKKLPSQDRWIISVISSSNTDVRKMNLKNVSRNILMWKMDGKIERKCSEGSGKQDHRSVFLPHLLSIINVRFQQGILNYSNR